MIPAIILSSLLHILIIIICEACLFLFVLAQIETNALDNAVKSVFGKLLSASMLQNSQQLTTAPGSSLIKEDITNILAQREKDFINHQNTGAINNLYKLVCGLVISIILLLYYIRFYSASSSLNWTHSISVIVLIFILIAIYELILINTVLKSAQNEQTIILQVANLL